MRKANIIIFVIIFLVFLPALNLEGKSVTKQTIRANPPSFDYVGMYYPRTQPITNNSIVYICTSFNITVNISDDTGLERLNITYNGHRDSFSFGSVPSTSVEDIIVISGAGVYHVELTLEDADKLIAYYYFTVICCDGREPDVYVYDNDILLLPESPIYRCRNTTLTIIVNSADGIDIVVITIKHNGEVLENYVYDLSTEDIDVSFVDTITVPIWLPGTYMVEIYARDMCNNSISLTYLIVCNDSLMPPTIRKFEIRCNDSQSSVILSNGSCICCCKFDLEVSVFDSDGISRLELYIDDTLAASYVPSTFMTHVAYIFDSLSMPAEGVYLLKFKAIDTYGDSTTYIVYLICDNTLPTVNITVNNESLAYGATYDVDSGEIVDVDISISDSTRLQYVEIDAQDVPIATYSFPSCISSTNHMEFHYNVNVSEWILNYSGMSSLQIPVLRIMVMAIDICGHATTFYILIHVSTVSTLRPVESLSPIRILLTPSGVAIVLGFSTVASIATLIVYTRIIKKEIG